MRAHLPSATIVDRSGAGGHNHPNARIELAEDRRHEGLFKAPGGHHYRSSRLFETLDICWPPRSCSELALACQNLADGICGQSSMRTGRSPAWSFLARHARFRKNGPCATSRAGEPIFGLSPGPINAQVISVAGRGEPRTVSPLMMTSYSLTRQLGAS